MGLFSSSTKQSSNSTSTSGPWKPAQKAAENFANQLTYMGNNTNWNPTAKQNWAFNQLEQNAANPYANQFRGMADAAMGNAQTAQGSVGDYTGISNDAYKTLQTNMGDLASGKYLDPMSNPQMQAMLQQVGDDINNRTNAQFAAAGRDMSGMNSLASARGVSQGTLGLLLDQYNTNRTNQMNAANSLFSAGNQTASTNSGLDAQRMANYSAANTLAGQANDLTNQWQDARNQRANNILNIQQQRRDLPYQNMGTYASLLFPTAGLGGTQDVQSSGKTKSSPSIMSSITSLFSDARLKDDIKEVGALADGQRVYAYHYKDDPNHVTHIGLMAQEAETKAPSGSVGVDIATGFRTVDYDAATKKAAEIVAKRRGVK